jgi:hypothetical protein
MAKPKDHGPEHLRRHQHERENSGDDPLRHTEIIARRWLGSPPPTFDRYAKALKQWSALPGAVTGPIADETDNDKGER